VRCGYHGLPASALVTTQEYFPDNQKYIPATAGTTPALHLSVQDLWLSRGAIKTVVGAVRMLLIEHSEPEPVPIGGTFPPSKGTGSNTTVVSCPSNGGVPDCEYVSEPSLALEPFRLKHVRHLKSHAAHPDLQTRDTARTDTV
jgi:hypothetical protein